MTVSKKNTRVKNNKRISNVTVEIRNYVFINNVLKMQKSFGWKHYNNEHTNTI